MSERLFVALDVGTLDAAEALVRRLDGVATRYKVGLELFAGAGPGAVERVRALGAEVFVDLKLHDIPETVHRAARAVAASGAGWLTVHAAGGEAMLRAAVEGAGASTRVLAVTVLTSMDLADLAAVGWGTPSEAPAPEKGAGAGESSASRWAGAASPSIEALVVRRARLAVAAGCAGVVASPREAAALRAALGPDVLVVTPGVRGGGFSDAPPSDGAAVSRPARPDDQKRTATARQAIAAGADAVVVGRPIRDAADPRAAALAIVAELARAAAERASTEGRSDERAVTVDGSHGDGEPGRRR